MSKQNVYDNDAFFEKFQSSRGNEVNFNDCIETPILLAMLPDELQSGTQGGAAAQNASAEQRVDQ